MKKKNYFILLNKILGNKKINEIRKKLKLSNPLKNYDYSSGSNDDILSIKQISNLIKNSE